MTARRLAVLAALALLGVAGLAVAAGPLDGVYVVTGTGTGMDPVTFALMVTQTGTRIGVALLDPLDNSWTYLIGPLDADQRVDGPLLFGDGLQAGSLSVRFQGADVTGTVTLFEVRYDVSGSKLF